MSPICANVASLVFQVYELHMGGVSQAQALQYLRDVPAAISHPIVVIEYTQKHTVPIETRMELAQLSCETTYSRRFHDEHRHHDR